MFNFYQYFKESANANIDNFRALWIKALEGSEELRVGLELMRDIKGKFPAPEQEIYIVGGVPRDILLGTDIDDVDMATNIPFGELAKYYQLADISKNGSQPVFTIKFKNYNFDLAKFREDSHGVAGRHNNVSTEIDNFETDTKRRDITINSFGLDASGRIVDYQNGLDDLKNKIVRAVGDARQRFMEDATRILRVFRFASKLGFSLDKETLEAAKDLKHLLDDGESISIESVSKELYKAAKSGPGLARFLVDLDDADILEKILPEFGHMNGFTHDPAHHPEGDSLVTGHILECLKVSPFNDPVINLAVLFHDFGKAVTRGTKANGHSSYHGHEAAGVPIVTNIFERLRFPDLSAQDKKHILDAVANHMLVHSLDKLNLKTKARLILSPSWSVVKSVGYCDEASRGAGHFNQKEFEVKIDRNEKQVHGLGADNNELRKRISRYVNGDILMNWYEEFRRNPRLLKPALADIQDYVISVLDKGQEPEEIIIRRLAEKHLTGE